MRCICWYWHCGFVTTIPNPMLLQNQYHALQLLVLTLCFGDKDSKSHTITKSIPFVASVGIDIVFLRHNTMRCFCWYQSSESPIPDNHFCSENGVSCPCERNKIGDLELWSVLTLCFCDKDSKSHTTTKSIPCVSSVGIDIVVL